MDIKQILVSEFSLKNTQVDNIIEFINDGKTIPFIARYRKETAKIGRASCRERV